MIPRSFRLNSWQAVLSSLTPDEQAELFDLLFFYALDGIDRDLNSNFSDFAQYAASKGRTFDWLELFLDGPRAPEIAAEWPWAEGVRKCLTKMKRQRELIERAARAAA